MKEKVKIQIKENEIVRSPFANGSCHKYRLALKYNNKTFTFSFHDSVRNYEEGKNLNKEDALYCVLTDSYCYEDTRNIKDFLNAFGYDEFDLYPYIENGYTLADLYSFASGVDVDQLRAGLKAYRGCKRAFEKLHEIFTEKELEELQEEFQNY